MKTRYVAALSVFAGAAIGALSVGGLYAQSKSPGAYVIVDISEVTNPDGFKQLFPKAPPAVAAFDGHFVTRTEKISALDGTPPKRFVIIPTAWTKQKLGMLLLLKKKSMTSG